MSAKPAKKSAAPPPPAPSPVEAPVVAGTADTAAAAETSWIDSADPRKRRWGRIVLIGVWLYVAALWLLALDRTFDWGIFGPKTPPLP